MKSYLNLEGNNKFRFYEMFHFDMHYYLHYHFEIAELKN